MRTVAKTLSYSSMHFIVALGVAYALTGDWRVALGIGLIEPAVQTLAYLVHERAWSSVPMKAASVQRGNAANIAA
jgi:uncharacterized membrane protein